jgi:pimeloyl-ACP methyl ester carboxylesterase
VFYFHGFPGSSLEVEIFNGNSIATELKIRLIAVDRPGYGGSDGKKNRTLEGWAKDVADLADDLGMEKFSVLGNSGGGPFALACAYWIPERLKKVVVVSGMGTADAPGFRETPAWTLLKGPGFMLSVMMMGMKKMLDRDPEKFITSMKNNLPLVDKEIMNQIGMGMGFIAALKEAFRISTKGAMQDAGILKRTWDFSLQDVVQQVDLWHGEQDQNVKIETARFMAGKLPNCAPHYFPEEGHLSLIGNRFGEILKLMAAK